MGDGCMAIVPRVLFLGTGSSFSVPPLLALLSASVEVIGIILPATRAGPSNLPVRERRPPLALPMLHEPAHWDIASVGWKRGIPVLEIGRLSHPDVVRALAGFEPDFICVACFPRRLPRPILDLPTCGCLNVHPSLLPENRGPAPLFWTFRSGAPYTGVTVHLMTEALDEGDIISQASQEVPEGISAEEMDRRCASVGGRLLVEAVQGIWSDTAIRVPQRLGEGSYQGWPQLGDFEIPVAWSAARAFRFIRGTEEWAIPPVILAGNERLLVQSAIGYVEKGHLPGPYLSSGGQLHVQFNPGILRVRASRE